MAYGLDMRKRAMELVDDGKSFCAVGEMLGVSWWTVSNWHKRYKEDRLGAEYPKHRGAYTINDESLLAHLEEHPDSYLEELHRSQAAQHKEYVMPASASVLRAKKDSTVPRTG
jgi:transposase